jgi:hypothetical protein
LDRRVFQLLPVPWGLTVQGDIQQLCSQALQQVVTTSSSKQLSTSLVVESRLLQSLLRRDVQCKAPLVIVINLDRRADRYCSSVLTMLLTDRLFG